MNIHEYQGKAILRQFGINVPAGKVAFNAEEAVGNAQELGGDIWVVKAQIHAGGRGKAGGVKVARSLEEVEKYAQEMLGKKLVTKQTGPEGKIVNRLLIESGCNIDKEYYLSFVIDREKEKITCIASPAGGMEIEEVAAKEPDKIYQEYIDIHVGLLSFQARRLAYKLGFPREQVNKVVDILQKLYRVFLAQDCSLLEINPLVETKEHNIIPLDVKMNLDDSAAYRHPEWADMRDNSEDDHKEIEANSIGLNYVNLGGDVACMVNGAGLAMATVDIIHYYGGSPANFLDVGGQGTAEDNAKAFRIMTEDGQAKGIFVNIFGGINKCDTIADGLVRACQMLDLKLPIVVRLEGTNVNEGMQILKEASLPNVHIVKSMPEGAKKIIALVKEQEE